MACQYRQHPGADHIAYRGRVRARVEQRAVADQRIEPARDFQNSTK
jgi:hypothetical protein